MWYVALDKDPLHGMNTDEFVNWFRDNVVLTDLMQALDQCVAGIRLGFTPKNNLLLGFRRGAFIAQVRGWVGLCTWKDLQKEPDRLQEAEGRLCTACRKIGSQSSKAFSDANFLFGLEVDQQGSFFKIYEYVSTVGAFKNQLDLRGHLSHLVNDGAPRWMSIHLADSSGT